MDEVDGMAGNEDRGGIQELINLIKNTHIPIICMCNDRNNQKMKTFVTYCFDLRFNKPKLEQIRVIESIFILCFVCLLLMIKLLGCNDVTLLQGRHSDCAKCFNRNNKWGRL